MVGLFEPNQSVDALLFARENSSLKAGDEKTNGTLLGKILHFNLSTTTTLTYTTGSTNTDTVTTSTSTAISECRSGTYMEA